MKIVRLKAEGKSTREITEILDSTENSVKVRMTKARKKIESTILIPAGYFPLSKFTTDKVNRPRLIEAIRRGSLKQIKIFGRHYTTDEAMGNYIMRRKQDKQLIDQGYVTLVDHTTAREYQMFIYSDLILRNNGRVLIKMGDLEKLKETPRQIPSFRPTPFHERLISLCRSNSVFSLAQKDIKKGKLQGVRHRNIMFVTQEDFDKWRKEREGRKPQR